MGLSTPAPSTTTPRRLSTPLSPLRPPPQAHRPACRGLDPKLTTAPAKGNVPARPPPVRARSHRTPAAWPPTPSRARDYTTATRSSRQATARIYDRTRKRFRECQAPSFAGPGSCHGRPSARSRSPPIARRGRGRCRCSSSLRVSRSPPTAPKEVWILDRRSALLSLSSLTPFKRAGGHGRRGPGSGRLLRAPDGERLERGGRRRIGRQTNTTV